MLIMCWLGPKAHVSQKHSGDMMVLGPTLPKVESTLLSHAMALHAGAANGSGNPAGALADVDEKELAQRDAHIRSFAIAQVRAPSLTECSASLQVLLSPSCLDAGGAPLRLYSPKKAARRAHSWDRSSARCGCWE